LQGVLAQAKNGDCSLGKRNFMQLMGRPQACNQGALPFFLSSFGGGEKGIFFIFPWFPMRSHYVPFKFSMGSQYLPQVSNVFPNIFSVAPHFYPIFFGKCCPPFTLIGGPKGEELYISK
jgi:hypothetical protein